LSVNSDCHCPMEIISTCPQLTVQGNRRHFVDPFLGCTYFDAIPREQGGTIPEASDTIELFTHEPARGIMLRRVIRLSQHHLNVAFAAVFLSQSFDFSFFSYFWFEW
ncbi:MAG: hypothetical protein ACK559_20625, partial [bacterium]